MVRRTYAQHEDEAAGDQAEGGNNLCRRTRWQIGRWGPGVQQDVRRSTSQRKSDQEVPPLLVDHSRCHAILVVRSHHHAQEHDHQRRHGVERHSLRIGNLPSTL
jgi:hypothetical protein